MSEWIPIDIWLRDLEERQTRGLPRQVLLAWEMQLRGDRTLCPGHGSYYRRALED